MLPLRVQTLMDILKGVYLCGYAVFTVVLIYANNFSQETELDQIPRQGISKIQRKVQISPFSKGMISQEINTTPANIASDRLFPSDVNWNLNMNTL